MIFNILLVGKAIDNEKGYKENIEKLILKQQEKIKIYEQNLFNNIKVEMGEINVNSTVRRYGGISETFFQAFMENKKDNLFIYIPEGTCSICIEKVLLEPIDKIMIKKNKKDMVILTDFTHPRDLIAMCKQIGINMPIYLMEKDLMTDNNSITVPILFYINDCIEIKNVFTPDLNNPALTEKYLNLTSNTN